MLAKVRPSVDIIIEQDHRPVAIIRACYPSGRPIAEIRREAKQRNSPVTLDEDFGRDAEEIVASHQKPRWD